MFIQRLTVDNFKNYDKAEVAFDTQIISLTGRNGMGKTNLLDAIHYLSFTRSALNLADQQNVRYNEAYFAIRAHVLKEEKVHQLQCTFETGGAGKKFMVDKQPLEKLSSHIGSFPVVLISPNDTDLVREWSELRRKFFDGLICQMDVVYMESLIKYNHLLKQRNALLKSARPGTPPDGTLLDQYDQGLVFHGKQLYEKRKDFVGQFNPVFLNRYQQLASGEEVTIRYLSDYDRIDPEKGMAASRSKDLIMQRTTFGIHRDDYEFLLGEKALKRTGSQGQQKSFVIALRLAQFDLLAEQKGFKPVLLLDDIFDKLDDTRIERLTEMVKAHTFGQIFITDARPERTTTLVGQLEEKVSIFNVENGCITLST